MGSLRVGQDSATSLSCIGEGNGNPLQYSCLEIPMDRGAWWATVHWVTKSQARLKQLSTHTGEVFWAQGKRASAQQLCLLDSSFSTLTLPRSSPIRRGSGQPSCRTQRHFLGTHRDPSLGQGLVHPSTSPLRLTPLSWPLTPGLHCTFSQVWNWRPKGVAAPWSRITQ